MNAEIAPPERDRLLERLPYGLWRRIAPRRLLDDHECALRDSEEAWDLRNEALADRLDARVGASVRLREEWLTCTVRYRAGAEFIVLGRVRDALLCESVRLYDGATVVVLLREDRLA